MTHNEDESGRRVTVIFAPQTYAKLDYIASTKGISKTEALRQSLSLSEYLERAQQDGAKILIERAGKLSELVVH